ncbi:uncharacterized protein BJX67DRAFT_146793 [Aspergillus lucknowensis]|uniref:Uncharacterized protein n=1 Tax=Aspergillus lucknowensis TaxID=176173 RepID=A0ABR4LP70_9EURO
MTQDTRADIHKRGIGVSHLLKLQRIIPGLILTWSVLVNILQLVERWVWGGGNTIHFVAMGPLLSCNFHYISTINARPQINEMKVHLLLAPPMTSTLR